MNIFWIITLIIAISITIVFFIALIITREKVKTLEKNSELLKEQFIKNANKPIIIWIAPKYTKKDIALLWANTEVLEVLIKYVEYTIFIKADTTRNLHDWVSSEEKAWHLNWLHEIHRFLWKILHKPIKKEEKPSQKLV